MRSTLWRGGVTTASRSPISPGVANSSGSISRSRQTCSFPDPRPSCWSSWRSPGSRPTQPRIVNATFIESDWFARVPRERFAVVLANPPYVAEHDPHLLQGDLRYEPARALSPGGDGLDAMRAIVAAASGHLAPGGALALEHGHDQAGAVQALLHEAGFVAITSARDLAGIPRVTHGRRDGS